MSAPLFGARAHELSASGKPIEKVPALVDLIHFINGLGESDMETFQKNLDCFLKAGGSIEADFHEKGTMLYHAIHRVNDRRSSRIIPCLLARGANTNHRNSHGETLLQSVMLHYRGDMQPTEMARFLKSVRYLLEAGVDCDTKSLNRATPYPIAELLLAEGVTIEPNVEASYHASIHDLVKQEIARRQGFDPFKYHEDVTDGIYAFLGNDKNVSQIIADYAKSSRNVRLEKPLRPVEEETYASKRLKALKAAAHKP